MYHRLLGLGVLLQCWSYAAPYARALTNPAFAALRLPSATEAVRKLFTQQLL